MANPATKLVPLLRKQSAMLSLQARAGRGTDSQRGSQRLRPGLGASRSTACPTGAEDTLGAGPEPQLHGLKLGLTHSHPGRVRPQGSNRV